MHPIPLRRHILAFDDGPVILELYEALLGDAGYRVTTRRTPSPDLEEVRIVAPDLILLDLSMGQHGRGEAFLERLWGDGGLRWTPVVVCSGDPRGLAGLTPWLLDRRCGIVAKPFVNEVLLEVIRLGLLRGRAPLPTLPSAPILPAAA